MLGCGYGSLSVCLGVRMGECLNVMCICGIMCSCSQIWFFFAFVAEYRGCERVCVSLPVRVWVWICD